MRLDLTFINIIYHNLPSDINIYINCYVIYLIAVVIKLLPNRVDILTLDKTVIS